MTHLPLSYPLFIFSQSPLFVFFCIFTPNYIPYLYNHHFALTDLDRRNRKIENIKIKNKNRKYILTAFLHGDIVLKIEK